MAGNDHGDDQDIDDVSKQLSESCVIDTDTSTDQSAGLTADTDIPVLDKASQTDSCDPFYDYSKLPILTWMEIFSYLEVRDRLMLSVTCRTIHGFCQASSLPWRSAIFSMGGDSSLPLSDTMFNKTAKSVLGMHGYKMRYVTFQLKELMGFSLSSESRSLLYEVVESWNLKSLDIRCAGDQESAVIPTCVENVLQLCITSPAASSLSSLHISTPFWVNENGQSGAIAALKQSSFTSSLRCLYLEEVMLRSLDTCELIDLIGRYSNLHSLAIPLSYLTSGLQNNFPGTLEVIYLIKYSVLKVDEDTVWSQVLELGQRYRVGLVYVGHLHKKTVPQVLPSLFQDSTVTYPSSDGTPGKLRVIAPMCSDQTRVLNFTKDDVQADLEDDLLESVRGGTYRKWGYVFKHGPSDSRTKRSSHVTLANLEQWRRMEVDAMPIVLSDSRHKVEDLQKLCVEFSRYFSHRWKSGSEIGVIESQFPADMPPLDLAILPQGVTI